MLFAFNLEVKCQNVDIKQDSIKQFIDSIAQAKKDSTHDAVDSILNSIEDKSHFEVELDYANHVVSAGRRYGLLKNREFYPSIKYYHKSGLSFQIENSFITYPATKTNKKKPANSTTQTNNSSTNTDFILSYSHSLTDNWSFGAEYTYWRTNDTTTDHSLAKNSMFDVNTDYDFNYFTVNLDGAYIFSEEPTPTISLSVYHTFSLYQTLGALKFNICPQAKMYWGSESVSLHGLAKEYKKNKKSNPTVNTNKFDLMYYQFQVSMDYHLKNFVFDFTPKYVIPMNVPEANKKTYETESTPFFYFIASIKYMFKIKK